MTKKYHIEVKTRLVVRLFLGTLFTILLAWAPTVSWGGTAKVSAQSPTPTPDRLAEPPLSEEPTQYEQGTWLYWYHCMPCHGDLGQGLTEEFIDLWPEDHQNCWGRGCHGGRIEDGGFPIPKTIPAVIGAESGTLKFAKPDDLYAFLNATHPPQYPGHLTEEEYWAITDFIFVQNDRLSPKKEIGPNAGFNLWENSVVLAAIGGGVLVLVALLVWLSLRHRRQTELADNIENFDQ